jgi:hypothetical protein
VAPKLVIPGWERQPSRLHLPRTGALPPRRPSDCRAPPPLDRLQPKLGRAPGIATPTGGRHRWQRPYRAASPPSFVTPAALLCAGSSSCPAISTAIVATVNTRVRHQRPKGLPAEGNGWSGGLRSEPPSGARSSAWSERPTHNRLVAGSKPAGPTNGPIFRTFDHGSR